MSNERDALAETEVQQLQLAAENAATHAYARYSSFRVGAALRLTTGEIVTGANVENASYGLTICAERSAVCTMVAQYGPKARIDAVCVTNLNKAASSPCGACRQVLAEFMDDDAWIVFPGANGEREVRRMRELLPFGFELA
jgi:cytidine deaminase